MSSNDEKITFERSDAHDWDIIQNDEIIGTLYRVFERRYSYSFASAFAIDRSKPHTWRMSIFADEASWTLRENFEVGEPGCTFHAAKREALTLIADNQK